MTHVYSSSSGELKGGGEVIFFSYFNVYSDDTEEINKGLIA